MTEGTLLPSTTFADFVSETSPPFERHSLMNCSIFRSDSRATARLDGLLRSVGRTTSRSLYSYFAPLEVVVTTASSGAS
jgi:hypothetical protein